MPFWCTARFKKTCALTDRSHYDAPHWMEQPALKRGLHMKRPRHALAYCAPPQSSITSNLGVIYAAAPAEASCHSQSCLPPCVAATRNDPIPMRSTKCNDLRTQHLCRSCAHVRCQIMFICDAIHAAVPTKVRPWHASPRNRVGTQKCLVNKSPGTYSSSE